MVDFNCKKCGHKDYVLKETTNHTGLYCALCDCFQKWIPKSELYRYERQKKTEDGLPDMLVINGIKYRRESNHQDTNC